MFNALASLATGRPKRVLIIAAVVAIGSFVVSSGLPDRLAAQGFNNPDSESQKAIDRVAEAAGFDPTSQIVALVKAPSGSDITSAAGKKEVNAVAAKLADVEGAKQISTPFAKDTPPSAAKLMIAKDGDSALVVASMEDGAEETDAAEQAIAAFENDKAVTLGGLTVAQHYVSTTVEKDLRTSEMIAFPLLFLISLVVFRGLIAAALPLLIGAITIPVTFALVGVYNEMTSLSIFALNLTTGMGLGLAIDYSLLMVTRFREELDAGAETVQAVKTMIGTAGRTITFSSLTVAGSVLALAIFPLKFLYSMAFAGFTVAIASALVSLIVLPALLMLLGPRINKFSIARTTVESSNKRWYHLAKGVMRRPAVVAIGTTAILLVMALPLMNISFTSVDATVLPKENSAHVVADAVSADYPDNPANATLFVAANGTAKDAPKVQALAKEFAATPGVEKVLPPQQMGKDVWMFSAFAKDTQYSQTATDAVTTFRESQTGSNALVGGTTANFADQRTTIVDRVPLALLLIGGITFLVLFLMTGSIVLPIKTFIMNLLTLAATFGILTFIFGEGRFESLLGYSSQNALEMTQPVLLFAIAFGLATDYGVFLLGRVKEFHDAGMSNEEAVANGVGHTGRVITSAALLFCVAIGAFSLSSIVFIKELGVGTALAVAIDATIVRALLVPALMAMLGDYNWWAPRWMKRIHARIGLSEGQSVSANSQTIAESL